MLFTSTITISKILKYVVDTQLKIRLQSYSNLNQTEFHDGVNVLWKWYDLTTLKDNILLYPSEQYIFQFYDKFTTIKKSKSLRNWNWILVNPVFFNNISADVIFISYDALNKLLLIIIRCIIIITFFVPIRNTLWKQ